METIIVGIIAGFINSISDKSKAKTIIEAILKYATDVVAGAESYIQNGVLPNMPALANLPPWAQAAINLIPEFLLLVPKQVASVESFLNPIITKCNEVLGELNAALNLEQTNAVAATQNAITLDSVNATVAKVKQAQQIQAAIPDNTHPNQPVMKKILGEILQSLVAVGPEVVGLIAKAKGE